MALRRHRHRQDDARDADLQGALWSRAASVAIYSLPKLLARIRRTYDSDPGGDSYLPFFERLTSVDLLHIDDLGAEKRSDWVLEQLYALVNERYEAQRSVLITTNLPHEELEEQIGSTNRLPAESDLRRGGPVRGRPSLREGRLAPFAAPRWPPPDPAGAGA